MIVFALTGGPASEPVSASDLRAHAYLRDQGAAQTTLIDSYLLAARHLIEKWTGRSLIAQTWTAALEAWPELGEDNRVRIRLSPFPASVSSVAVDGVALSSALYTLRGDELVFDEELDTAPEGDDPTDGIVVTFTSSAGLTAAPPLGLAIKQLAAHFYENREATAEESLYAVPGLAEIVRTYRVVRELN